MKKIIVFILIGVVVNAEASAQLFYFPKLISGDSVAFHKTMSTLAQEIIDSYKPIADEKTYLRNLLTLQMVADRYPDAVNSIRSLRQFYIGSNTKYPEFLSVQYELFCRAIIEEDTNNSSFEKAFTEEFLRLYDKLDDKAALYISTAFLTRAGIRDVQNNLDVSLRQQKSDSINLAEAIAICRNYNILRVYKIIEPLAMRLLMEDDKKRYIIDDSVVIRTKDGAFISAIVVRKKGVSQKQYAILQFSIYARQNDLNRIKDVAANGYVGVIAYTRGKRYSPGAVWPYEYDGRDAYEVIDWISKQSWSNGKVGMFGGSYNGFTTWAATKKLHPALKTIVPSAAVAPGLDVPMMNNVFMSFTFPWSYYVSNNKFLDDADYNDTVWTKANNDWYASGRAYYTLDSVLGRKPNIIYRRWLSHPGYDQYWQNMIPYKNEFAKIDIPVLSTTGYYDGGQVGAMYYFREHHKYNKKAVHYLLIGPYGHFGSQSTPDAVYNGYAIDSAANISIHDVIFQWFDHILKDSALPSILKDKINYEVMGSNKWKHASSLTKMSNDTLTFYLSSEKSVKDYKAKEKWSPVNNFVLQKVDFTDRSSTNNYYFASQVIYDSLDASNGITFVSEPLEKEIEINGSFWGQLTASINKRDMDYSINLYELMPNGKYFYLSYFMGRASYAFDGNKRQLLIPGKVHSIPFSNSYVTSKKLSKGSRIVFVLNINKSPNEQINYGTGKDVSKETIQDAGVPLEIKWYDKSYIKIPVWR